MSQQLDASTLSQRLQPSKLARRLADISTRYLTGRDPVTVEIAACIIELIAHGHGGSHTDMVSAAPSVTGDDLMRKPTITTGTHIVGGGQVQGKAGASSLQLSPGRGVFGAGGRSMVAQA